MRTVLLAGLVLAAAGCSAEPPVLYLPDMTSVVSIAGYPAARYEVPPQVPRGSVRVASFGVTWIDVPGRVPVRALHARLLVENRDDRGPWEVDVRDLQALFPTSPPASATLVNTTTSRLPILEIPPGREVVLDAYFLLPPALGRGDAPAFEVAWGVTTPDGPVAGRTRFERRVLEAGPGTTVRFGYGLGLSPYWWLTPRVRPPAAATIRPPRVYLGYPSGK